jgi:streptogramin lyase
VVVRPDGNLLVSSFATGAILQYDGETGAFLGELFSDRSVLEEPVRMRLREGKLYVLGNDTANIVVIDPEDGKLLNQFGYRTMRFPHDFDVGPDGLFYVAMEWNKMPGMVQRWDPLDSRVVDSFVPWTEASLLVGITFGPGGDIYVSDWFLDRIVRYDGQSLEQTDVFVDSGGELRDPISLRFGPDGHLYVIADESILRFDGETGEFHRVVVKRGEDGMAWPRGFCLVSTPPRDEGPR